MSNNAKENQIKYINEWKRQNVKRIGLEVSKEKYEEIKLSAEKHGEKINTYIKNAIDERLSKDNDL